MTALTCSRCGAPLPPPNDAKRTLGCEWCGATSVVPGAAPSGGAFDSERWLRAIETFREKSTAGATPYDALVAAAREQLGQAGLTDTFARVVLALANDFDAQHGTRVATDPLVLTRLIEAYAKATEGLRAQGRHTLEVKFLTATERGPLHLERELTAADVAALAARPPVVAPPKKKWWPFG